MTSRWSFGVFCNVFVFCVIRVQDPVKSTLFFIIQINLI